jgi:hypothetical protein
MNIFYKKEETQKLPDRRTYFYKKKKSRSRQRYQFQKLSKGINKGEKADVSQP